MRCLRLTPVLLSTAAALAIGAQTAVADSITATCTPGPCGDWQSSNVRVEWKIDVPAATRTTGCELDTFSAEDVHSPTCTAWSGPNFIQSSTINVRIDRTAPTVMTVELAPPPNALGWHITPLTATFVGVDPGLATKVSGIQVCTRTTYAAPDSDRASVSGTCVDRAGNQSQPRTETFRFDVTAPALDSASSEIGDRMVRIRWSETDGPVEIVRSPGVGAAASSVIFTGDARSFTDRRVKNLVAYRYDVSTSDAAGNRTTKSVAARPARRILSPANGTTVGSPPRIEWSEIPNASYYNVQVFRGSTKVLSAWPKRPELRLRNRWTFQGRSIQLTDGAYRVFVWPGFGAFAKQNYGRIVGTTTFTKR